MLPMHCEARREVHLTLTNMRLGARRAKPESSGMPPLARLLCRERRCHDFPTQSFVSQTNKAGKLSLIFLSCPSIPQEKEGIVLTGRSQNYFTMGCLLVANFAGSVEVSEEFVEKQTGDNCQLDRHNLLRTPCGTVPATNRPFLSTGH